MGEGDKWIKYTIVGILSENPLLCQVNFDGNERESVKLCKNLEIAKTNSNQREQKIFDANKESSNTPLGFFVGKARHVIIVSLIVLR